MSKLSEFRSKNLHLTAMLLVCDEVLENLITGQWSIQYHTDEIYRIRQTITSVLEENEKENITLKLLEHLKKNS